MTKRKEQQTRRRLRIYLTSSDHRLKSFAQGIQEKIYSDKITYRDAQQSIDEFELGCGAMMNHFYARRFMKRR